MNINLVRLTPQYREQLFEMLTEWKADIENNRTNPSPYAIFRNDFHDFDYYLPQGVKVSVGQRVIVPFGKGGKKRVGLVTGFKQNADYGRLKDIYCVRQLIYISQVNSYIPRFPRETKS